MFFSPFFSVNLHASRKKHLKHKPPASTTTAIATTTISNDQLLQVKPHKNRKASRSSSTNSQPSEMNHAPNLHSPISENSLPPCSEPALLNVPKAEKINAVLSSEPTKTVAKTKKAAKKPKKTKAKAKAKSKSGKAKKSKKKSVKKSIDSDRLIKKIYSMPSTPLKSLMSSSSSSSAALVNAMMSQLKAVSTPTTPTKLQLPVERFKNKSKILDSNMRKVRIGLQQAMLMSNHEKSGLTPLKEEDLDFDGESTLGGGGGKKSKAKKSKAKKKKQGKSLNKELKVSLQCFFRASLFFILLKGQLHHHQGFSLI